VRKSKTPLTIFLVNGVKLQGVVSWFDNFCVLLRRDGQSQLVLQARHIHNHARAASSAV
jgi:host factor-I protein